MCVSWADCKSKILSFWSVLSYSIKQPFLNQIVMCNGRWILYNNELSGWTEKKLQSTSWSQICTKKRVVITVWWSAARLIHYSFLNPRESIVSEKYAQQIDEIHQKLQCLQPALVNRKGPILLYNNAQSLVTQPVLQKLNELGYEVCLTRHIHLPSHQLTTTSSSISITFAGKILPQPAGCRKCFPRVPQILKHRFLCYRNKQTFLICKTVLIEIAPILINKDEFEPSYNDLKFRVQNHNYFCTNLIVWT